jgi:hypothetical protein
MSHENSSEFMKYLQGQDDTTEQKKLNFFHGLGNSNTDPIGRVVHSLIMMKLMKRSNQEEKDNQEKRTKLFSEHQDRKFNEKKMLEELKYKLEAAKEKRELAKEDRQEKRDTIAHGREIDKENRRAAVQAAIEATKSKNKAIANSFEPNSADYVDYISNPKEAEKRRKVKDSNALIKKVFGYGLQGASLGAIKYQPKMKSYLEKK